MEWILMMYRSPKRMHGLSSRKLHSLSYDVLDFLLSVAIRYLEVITICVISFL